MTDAGPTLAALLPPDDLATLRAAYDGRILLELAEKSLAGVSVPMRTIAATVRAAVYESQELSPRERELLLMMITAEARSPLSFAIHLYWGLMEGLELRQVSGLLALLCVYRGVPASHDCGSWASQALSALSSVARSSACGPLPVVAGLQQRMKG